MASSPLTRGQAEPFLSQQTHRSLLRSMMHIKRVTEKRNRGENERGQPSPTPSPLPHPLPPVLPPLQSTQRPRGFGFISFDTEDAVDRVLQRTFHDLNGKQVEVKRALPKEANPGGGGRSIGGSYQNYGASGGNTSSYDGRMERYMQPQGTGGGFPPYGSSGYSTAGYGYGPATNGVGYGGYSGYTGAGYRGPAGATYGNPNVPNAGYVSGAPRSSWNSQGSSGYGAMGYGNAASWGA